MADKIITHLARRGGNRLIDLTLGRVLPEDPTLPKKRPTLLGGLAGAAAVRIATRSVPGAIVVGGGWLAKTLYERRRAKRAKKPEAADQSTPKA
jgi:hypothetical protein